MTDPSLELFDLTDRDGRAIGVRKARPLVHRDGDWHRSFHCWVVTPGDVSPGVVLQKRADVKETWAGLWDVSVAGHYSAGEGIEGGLREMQEELGLVVAADELLHAGWRREEVHYENGLIEREIQDVFFLLRALDLSEIRSDTAEVSTVAIVPGDLLLGVIAGAPPRATVPGGHVLANGLIQPGLVSIETTELVPRADDYYAKATRFAIALARGELSAPEPVWWL